jgi:diguanylate cyclase (GGDEF)-like protein
VPILIAMGMVTLLTIVVPALLGLPMLSLFGVCILAALGLALRSIDRGPTEFRPLSHLVYFVAFPALGYAVFSQALPSAITVYFPALILLGSAHLLGARAAIFWAVPSLALVAAGVFLAPPAREVVPAITFAVRAGTLLTILAFAVAFRRSQDRQSEILERRATTDELTGLVNRREFDRALDEALVRALRFERQGALVFLDIDGLKRVNDDLGHAAGDLLIQFVAHRVSKITRRVDLAARFGGDEFVILLTEIEDEKGAEIYARKLLHALAEPLTLDGREMIPSASIGVAIFPDASQHAGELVRSADTAMYRAKRAGGSRIYLQDESTLREVH